MPGRDPIHTAKFDRAVEHIQAAGKRKGSSNAPPMVKSTGEGSRGGHVVGHTSSGKPIYQTEHGKDLRERHRGFTVQDHVDAMRVWGSEAAAHDQPHESGGGGVSRRAGRELNDHAEAARAKVLAAATDEEASARDYAAIRQARLTHPAERRVAAGFERERRQSAHPRGSYAALMAEGEDGEEDAKKAASPPPVGVPRKPKQDPGTVKQERDAAKKIEEEAGTAQPSRADMAKGLGLAGWLNEGGIMRRRPAGTVVRKAEAEAGEGGEAEEDDAKEKKLEQRVAEETGDVSPEDEEAAEARADRMDKGARPMGQPAFDQPAANPPEPMEAPEPAESPLPTARTGQSPHAKVRPSVTPAAKTIQQVPAVPRGEAQHAGEDPHGAMGSGTQDARMGKAGMVGRAGEGSRGGHVVGHTGSGQPIYAAAGGAHESKAAEHASQQAASSGSVVDHRAAQQAHQTAAQARHQAGNSALGAYHERKSQEHARQAGERGFKEAMTIKRSDEGGRGLANWLCKAIPGTEGAGAKMPMSGEGPDAGPGIPGTDGALAGAGKAGKQAAAGEGASIPGTEGSPQPPVGGSQALGASRPGKGDEEGIPGAEDVPGGQPPGHDLPDGSPSMDPGESVNGADLGDDAFAAAPAADGAVLSRTGPGKMAGTPETAGATEADAGKVTPLSPDDPQTGSSIEGEPGITSEDAGPDGAAMRTVGANRGQIGSDLSKSTRVLDVAEMQHASRMAAVRANRAAPRDVQHQPALQAPRLKKAEPPPPTVQFLNGTVYSTASDDAVDRLMNGGDGFYHGDAPALGVGGALLQKGAACRRCGGTVPAFLTVCPQCGGGEGLAKALPAGAPLVQKGRLRAPVGQELFLPNGLVPKR